MMWNDMRHSHLICFRSNKNYKFTSTFFTITIKIPYKWSLLICVTDCCCVFLFASTFPTVFWVAGSENRTRRINQKNLIRGRQSQPEVGWLVYQHIPWKSSFHPFFSLVGETRVFSPLFFSRGENHLPKRTHHFKKMVAPTSRYTVYWRIHVWQKKHPFPPFWLVGFKELRHHTRGFPIPGPWAKIPTNLTRASLFSTWLLFHKLR